MSKNVFKTVAVGATVAALTMSIGLVGCGGNTASTEKTTSETQSATVNQETEDITVGLFEGSYLSVPVLVARDKGYFEEEGLNVDWQPVSDDGATSVISGDLDVYCTGYSTALSAIAQGEESIEIIGGEMSQGCDYVVNAKSKIASVTSASDFEGLKIGVCMGDPGYYLTKALCEENNVDAKFVELDSVPATITAVEKGEVDMSIVCGAMSYDAIADGCKSLAKVSDLTGTFPCCRLQANTKYVEENPSAIQKFMRAALRGYETYVSDPDGTSEILAKVSGADAKSVKVRMYGTDDYDTPMAVSIDPEANAVINANEKFTECGTVAESDVNLADFIYVDGYKNALDSLATDYPDSATYKQLQEQFEANNSQAIK